MLEDPLFPAACPPFLSLWKSVLDRMVMWQASQTLRDSFYGETLDSLFEKAPCKARHSQVLPGGSLGMSVHTTVLMFAAGVRPSRLIRLLSNGQ